MCRQSLHWSCGGTLWHPTHPSVELPRLGSGGAVHSASIHQALTQHCPCTALLRARVSQTRAPTHTVCAGRFLSFRARLDARRAGLGRGGASNVRGTLACVASRFCGDAMGSVALVGLRCGFAMWSQAMGRVGCGQPGTRSCEGSGNLLRTRWGSGTAGHSAASGLGSMCGGKAHDLRWSQAGLHRTAFARLRTLYRVVG